MKELTIEQKAQRYDEAIEIAKKINNEQQAQPFNIMTRVFPELKESEESEDERKRKNLIELFHDTVSNDEIFSDYGLDKTKVLAWLEKQGEQKPAWSEEDETIINRILVICNDFERSFEASPLSTKVIKEDVDKIYNWLKSIKERHTWKPSEEQIMCLQDAIDDYHRRGYKAEVLETLLKQLKQL